VLGRSGHKRGEFIKADVKEVKLKGVEWIHVAEGRGE